MIMEKRIHILMAAAVLTCSSMLLTGCVEKDNPSDAPIAVVDPDIEEQPTDDQMTVRVTHTLPTAVIGQFGQNSTGAALVRRLATTTASIGTDTRMVLLQGSDYSDGSASLSAESMTPVAEVYMLGGYVALERPTLQQLANFIESLVVCGEQLQQQDLLESFEIPEEDIEEATESSIRERMQARMANVSSCATRAGETAADDVCAEIVIFDGDDCFYMEPMREEDAVGTYASDEEGRLLGDSLIIKRTVERTEFMAGQTADAIAEWLNEQEAEREQQAQQSEARAVTRADGTTAINELMEASETFTFNGQVYWRGYDNEIRWDFSRLQMTIRSWGVHNMQTHRDYYLVKQDVTLRMGETNLSLLFYCEGFSKYRWMRAQNFGEYNWWYGSFFSKYTTSLALDGKGTINCIAATPEAENTTTTETVQLGSSHTDSSTFGTSISATLGYKTGFQGLNPTVELNGSFTTAFSASGGWTNGTSFSLSGAKTHKDISVKKNSLDNKKVEWVYTGRLPKLTAPGEHEVVSDILVSDVTLRNEACWMVDNPDEQYTLNIHSVPETAALLHHYDIKNDKDLGTHYENCVTIYDNDFSHTLLEPNRAEQTWRMNIIINEWIDGPQAGAQRELEQYINKSYPDIYRNVFKVADKNPKSLQMANAIINYSKQVFGSQKDILQGIARSCGVKKFTITWRCDDPSIKLKEGYVVTVK